MKECSLYMKNTVNERKKLIRPFENFGLPVYLHLFLWSQLNEFNTMFYIQNENHKEKLHSLLSL